MKRYQSEIASVRRQLEKRIERAKTPEPQPRVRRSDNVACEDAPVLALCYDFDKTLSPDNMQAQGYIQAVGYDVPDNFWKKTNEFAAIHDMDKNLAYMYWMVKAARGKTIFTKEALAAYGAKVKLFPGVREWFARVNEYGRRVGVTVEHYILSSGLKEMIEGTSIAGEFKKIYAGSFYYDDDGVAVWPAQAINYTNKTQFLFRIKKGVLDINDEAVNDYFPEDRIRVPFRNIVYIGDSETDIPCMKLVHAEGGHAIGVYAPAASPERVYRLLNDGRINYFAPADYRRGGVLDTLVQEIVAQTAAREILERRRIAARKAAEQNANEP